MIDFHAYNSEHMTFTIESDAALKERAEVIKKNLSGDKRARFRLGYDLIDLFRSKDYRGKCADYYPVGNVSNCSGTVFFRYLKETFDLDRSTVSRLMNVADEFGDGEGRCAGEWSEYRWSALAEMLPLTGEQRKAVKPSWKREEIRAYKKTLTDSAASAEAGETKPKPAEPYPQFKGWKRNDFCRRIVDLEAENEELQKRLEALNRLLEGIGELDSGEKEIDFDTLDSLLTLATERKPA